MDENLHKDPLENLFRKNLEDPNLENSAPSPNDWDLPSDQVWAGIGEKLNPTATIPEKGIWLSAKMQVLAMAAGLLLLVGIFTCFRSYQRQLSSLSQQVEQLTEQQKATSEKVSPEGNDTPIIPENTTVTKPAEQIPASPTNEDQGIAPKTSVNAKQNTIQPDENNAKQVPVPAEKIIENTTSPTPPIAGHSPVATPASASPKQLATPNTEGQKQEQEQRTSTDFTPTAEQVEIATQTTEATSPSKEPISKEQALEPSFPMTVLAPLPVQDIASLLASPTTLDHSVSANNPIIDPFRKIGSKGFYAGLLYAPSVTYIKTKFSRRNPPPNRDNFGQTRTKTTAFMGLKLGYQFNDRWAIETEGRYGNASIKTRHTVELRYSRQRERETRPGQFRGDYSYSIPTAYGDVDTEISLLRESTIDLQEDAPLDVEIEAEQQFQVRSIPVVVKYRTGKGPLRLSIRGGVAANFISKENFKVVDTNVRVAGLRHNQTRANSRPNVTGRTSFDLLTGLGLDYQPSPHWRFSLEPSYAMGVKPVFKNARIKTFPRSLSVSAGINYQF